MADFSELIARHAPVVADGAWGTELVRRGATGSCPERWNAENAALVAEVAAAYVAAGSRVVLTNSFGGSPFKLAAHALDGRTEELNETAARISVEAARGGAAVLGSVGPTGKFLEPYGDVAEEAMEAAFRRQIKGLLAGGAGGIVVETMSDVREAACALRAARAEGARVVVVSMTFERKKAGMVTMMGVTPAQAVRELAPLGPDLIGANCGAGADDMAAVVRALSQATALPLWAKPNAGKPMLVGGATAHPETADEFAAKMRAVIDAGARVVGGCCGTTPEHIRRLCAALAAR
ncbi:MAG TPA: methionine synthase [Planctomycetes bacterium]|nr:methionine synthase [Planctomycetota bacterium]